MLILEPFMGIEYNTQGSKDLLVSHAYLLSYPIPMILFPCPLRTFAWKGRQKKFSEVLLGRGRGWGKYWLLTVLLVQLSLDMYTRYLTPGMHFFEFLSSIFLTHSIHLFQFLSQYIFLTLSMHFFKCLFCNSDLLKTEETIRDEIRSPGGGAGEDNCGSQ